VKNLPKRWEARDIPEKFFLTGIRPQAYGRVAKRSRRDVAYEEPPEFPGGLPSSRMWRKICSHFDSIRGSDQPRRQATARRHVLLLKAMQAVNLGRGLLPRRCQSRGCSEDGLCAAGERRRGGHAGAPRPISPALCHLVLAGRTRRKIPSLVFCSGGNTLGGFDPLDQVRLSQPSCMHEGRPPSP